MPAIHRFRGNGHDDQAGGQLLCGHLLGWPQTTDDLLDVDGRRCGAHATFGKSGDAFCGWAPTQMVDEHRRVEKEQHRSARPARIRVPAGPHPRGWVVIPLVGATLAKDARGRPQRLGAPRIVESLDDRTPNEGRSLAWTGKPVDLGDEVVVELYVHSHV